jgi:hypothetical protein
VTTLPPCECLCIAPPLLKHSDVVSLTRVLSCCAAVQLCAQGEERHV